MGRKGRRRRTPEPEPKPAARPLGPRLAGLVLLGGVIAVAAWLMVVRGANEAVPVLPTATPPEVDLSGVEPPVAERIGTLRRHVVLDPGSADAWGRLGLSLDVHSFPDAAVECYGVAAGLDPQAFRWPYYAGVLLAREGSLQARPWLEKAVAISPAHAGAQLRLGLLRYEAGNLDGAEDAFRKAAQSSSMSAQARVGLARVQLGGGALEDAERELQQALRSDPRSSDATALMAEVLRRRGERDQALELARAARALPESSIPNTPEDEAREQEGVSSHWMRQRGLAHLDRGEYAEAVRELSGALLIEPRGTTHHSLGMALQAMGRTEEAIAQYEKALDLEPDSAKTLNNLAALLQAEGRLREARTHLERALELDPSVMGSYYNLSVIQEIEGDLQESVSTLRRGLARDPEDRPLALRLAWLLATAASRFSETAGEALRLAESVAHREQPPTARTLMVLAAAQAAAGRPSDAANTAVEAERLARANHQSDLAAQIVAQRTTYEDLAK